jgi:8-amino-7-oxononanoate synthase
VTFEAHLRRALDALTRDALLRTPRVHEAAHAPELLIRGARVINLCSNDYLGFASDPAIARAAADALLEHGLGAGAARLVTGTHALHRRAEARLARFTAKPSALLFSTGYAANIGAVQALVGKDDVIFSDALNHASLIDGARLSRARVIIYRHGDPEHLAELLAAHRAQHRVALVITESLFSMDGDTAPLRELRALCDRYDAGLYVDEAHAIGVLGPNGRGLCAELTVHADVLMAGLGKAFGCAGAFIAGSSDLTTLLENRARSFVFSTAPPHALAAAALTACELVEQADDRRARLRANAIHVREQLTTFGYHVLPGEGPIIPAIIGSPDAVMTLSRSLFERGVFVQGIRPPTVPNGTSRLRITPIATHSDAQLARALDALGALRPTDVFVPPFHG